VECDDNATTSDDLSAWLESLRGTEDAALLAVATVTLQSWPAPYPVKPLLAMLKRPEVGALGKALIMKILEGYGVDVDGKGLLGVGIDLEAYALDPMTKYPGVSPN
jgi:hypothetical protein